MSDVFHVASMVDDCSTRERGKRLYPALLKFFRAWIPHESEVVISFENVKLVTPSFLDETIVRLVQDEPQGRVMLRDIRDFPMHSLMRMLQATGKSIRVDQVDEGVYSVAGAA